MSEEEKYLLLATLTMQLQTEPDNASLYLNRAKTYIAIGDTAKALADLDAAIARAPDLAEAYRLRGQLRFQLRDKASAFDDLQRAIALDPNILSDISGEYKTKDAPKTYRF